jgi:methionyl-tRNA synthetase
MKEGTFYVTTPIYYVNASPHIGHAYTTITADVISRFKRMWGYRVLFSTGTDEHGQKILESARAQNRDPKEHVDLYSQVFKDTWKKLHISYDEFIRTTEPRHERVVQYIVNKLYEQGDIYKGVYEGWYCVPCETFYQADELVGGNCPNCGRPVVWNKEEDYFFRMSKYGDKLLQHIENNPDFVQPPTRRQELLNRVKEGMRDLCISRKGLTWGIPIPFDKDYSIYVWVDALINYLTVAGYPEDKEKFETFWPAVHLVGKDILWFHAGIWPCILLALGVDVPKKVFAHGFWTVKKEKMSKSKGNIIDPIQMAESLVDKGFEWDIAVDAVRYFLMREVPLGLDGEYSDESFVHRVNSDLANDLGNLFFRSVGIINRYGDGIVPEKGEIEKELVSMKDSIVKNLDDAMTNFEYVRVLSDIWEFIGAVNKYLDQKAPWSLARDGKKEEFDSIMFNVFEAIRNIAILISPFMPKVSEYLLNSLGLDLGSSLKKEALDGWGKLRTDWKIPEVKPLFPRIEV